MWDTEVRHSSRELRNKTSWELSTTTRGTSKTLWTGIGFRGLEFRGLNLRCLVPCIPGPEIPFLLGSETSRPLVDVIGVPFPFQSQRRRHVPSRSVQSDTLFIQGCNVPEGSYERGVSLFPYGSVRREEVTHRNWRFR